MNLYYKGEIKMKNTLRKFMTGTLATTLALTSVFTGCSSKSVQGQDAETTDTKKEATKEDSKPASIKLVYQYWDFIPNQEKVFTDFAKQYKEETGIDITIEGQLNTDSGWQDILKTQIAAGSGPDIFHMDVNQLSAWENSVIQPLSPYYEETIYDQFVPSVIDAWKVDGTCYALPNSYSVVAMLYNQDMMKEAGVTVGEGWKLTEFEQVLEKLSTVYGDKKITYTDGKEYPYYLLGTSSLMYYFWLFNGVYEGTPLNETNNIAQQQYVEAIMKMAEWTDKGWLVQSADVLPGNLTTAFSSGGNVAFMPTGDWTPTSLYRQHHGIGVEQIDVTVPYASVMAPTGKDGKVFSEIYTQGIVMNKNLSGWEADAAAQFIEYMATSGAWLTARGPEAGGLGLPARTEWSQAYQTSWFEKPEERAAFIKTAEEGTIGLPDYQVEGIDLVTAIQQVINTAYDLAVKEGSMDTEAVRAEVVKGLEYQQELINVQLQENDIELSNPDGKVK